MSSTIIFYTSMLFACLLGVGAGWYLAFSRADGRSVFSRKKGGRKRRQKEKPSPQGRAGVSILKGRLFKGEEQNLSRKLHKQDRSSFSGFRSAETGEDHDEIIRTARSSQDNSYSYMAKEPK